MDSTRPDQVWLQLAYLFGNAHYREHGEKPNPAWVAAVENLTDEQIVAGMKNLAEQGLSFPANLSQFVAACKIAQDASTAPCWNQPRLAAPTDQQQKENANKAWDQMEALAGRSLRPQENDQ